MTRRVHFVWLVACSWSQLLRFDLMRMLVARSTFDVGGAATPFAFRRATVATRDVCDAFALACCFYVKPVLCLQSSVCLTRMLKAYGTPARLVIGYRPRPFLSHAWVEVDGHVVNDSQTYSERLNILYTS